MRVINKFIILTKADIDCLIEKHGKSIPSQSFMTLNGFFLINEGRRYSYIVKVCDQENGQRYPIFPFTLKVLDWNFWDPSEFTGTDDEKLKKVRILRDKIKENVIALVQNYKITASK